MANTITSAVRYINNDAELAKVFLRESYTADLVKENVAIGAKTVKYRKVTLLAAGASTAATLGTYSKSTGYTSIDIKSEWVEKELTQDKGNSMSIDKMDSEEAQSLEIANIHNKWLTTICVPAVDTYRFSAIVGTTGIVSPATATLDKDSVEAAIDVALDNLYDKGVKEGLVLYLSTPCYRALETAAKNKGQFGLGTWNGNYDAQVLMYGRAKVVKVPSAIIGDKVNFILTATPAVAAMVKYQENEYFDKIPGFGGRKAQVDSGIYHDCWVEPGAETAVYVHKHA